VKQKQKRLCNRLTKYYKITEEAAYGTVKRGNPGLQMSSWYSPAPSSETQNRKYGTQRGICNMY